MSTSLLTVVLALAAHSAALKVPITQRAVSGAPFGIHTASKVPNLKSLVPSSSSKVSLANVNDQAYFAACTLGDRDFNLQLVTESPDTWVVPNAEPASFGAKSLGLPELEISSDGGSVKGVPASAKSTLGPYTVADQVFLSATSAKVPAVTEYADGVLGLGFDTTSALQDATSSLNSTTARSFLAGVFASHPSDSHYFAISLGRSTDLKSERYGALYIGEVGTEHAAVLDAPSQAVVNGAKSWVIEVEALTIAGTKHAAKQQALIETGSSYVYLGEGLVTSIYSSISGAKYDSDLGVWFAPCLNQTTVSFTIGGREYAVNPLDLTQPTLGALSDGTSVTFCINKFRTNAATTQYDIILGDAFLHNTFTVFNFGVSGSAKTAAPFVKLLSVTDAAEAAKNFESSRKQELETYPPEGKIDDKDHSVAKSPVAANVAVASGTTTTTATPTPTKHKMNHKIGVSGKKNTKAGSTVKLNHQIAIAKNAEESTTSTNINSQVQQLLDFSPILLALLAANVVLGLGLCILGGYLIRANRAKKNKREPSRRDANATTTATSYTPVMTGDGPLSPNPYRDSVAVSEAPGKMSGNYRDSGIAFGEDAHSPRKVGFVAGRDSIALSDAPVQRGALTSPSRDSLAAPDGRPRVPSAASVYSQPGRSGSQMSLSPPGDDFAPPQPSFANGRRPTPAGDSPNAQLPGPGVGLRPQRQPSTGLPPPDSRALSMYDVAETSEHQLAAQPRRYSHVPPNFGGGAYVPPPFPANMAGSPMPPPRSPARSGSGPTGAHMRRPSH